MARAIMIQGAGSNVGKSMIVAGLARACANRGLNVAPFKPQNMSNNAAVTVDGGEIGRAQALQALAARKSAHTDMNPVLLKPETDTGAQVIVQGKRFATLRARDYSARKPSLLTATLESFRRLSREVDLVLVEGAGSPAEINLRAGDIANMGFAEAAGVPVCVPRPGETVEPEAPPSVERWWPEVAWKTAEESPVVSSGLDEPVGEAGYSEAA